MVRLTDATIRALKPKRDRYEKWEGNGFGVRVTPRGVKAFVFVYHFEGRPRRMTLGRFKAKGEVAQDGNTLTLAQARVAVESARADIENGIDPGAKVVQKRREERRAETIGQLIDLYLESYARPRKRSAGEDERILNKDVRPQWARRKVGNIERRDVVALLDGINARGAPIMANRTRAVLRRMFNFAIARDILKANPCLMIETYGIERRRERKLDLADIPKFWTGLDRVGAVPLIRTALRLLLVTAQRRVEVIGSRVGELNEAEAVWTIPGERTKNSREHVVPLSPLALSLIRAAKVEAAKIKGADLAPEDFLFLTTHGKGRGVAHVTPGSVTRALNRPADPKKGVEAMDDILGKRISPHDLRRTAITAMGGERIGASRFIRDRIINHTDRTPGTHYDINEYLSEKRTVLDQWADLLGELIPDSESPASVVHISAGKRA